MAQKRLRKVRAVPKIRSVPKSRRVDVTRAEFDHVIDLLNERGHIVNELREQVETNAHNNDVQFTRIAQIQADLDQIKRVLTTLAGAL